MSSYLSPDFLKFFVPLAGALIAWLANERKRRQLHEYEKKEQSYRELLISIQGLYIQTPDKESIKNFIIQYRLCWLYCPDEIIKKINGLLQLIHGKSSTDTVNAAASELILSIRKDLLGRKVVLKTKLEPGDYLHAISGE